MCAGVGERGVEGPAVLQSRARHAYLHDLLGDRAELEREGVALLLEQRVAHLGALETLLHTRQRPAGTRPHHSNAPRICVSPVSERACV